MTTSAIDDRFEQMVRQVDRVLEAVIERGYDDVREEYDDYSVLLEKYEFRRQVVFELYEGYFPPRRHEFEIQVLTTLVDAVASSGAVAYLAGAIATGVVGNAAYDFLKKGFAHLGRKLESIERSRDAFREVERNLDGIRRFFQDREQATMREICAALDVEANKVEPLLKLLGFRCRRNRRGNTWLRPVR
jgi:hypothetical protein